MPELVELYSHVVTNDYHYMTSLNFFRQTTCANKTTRPAAVIAHCVMFARSLALQKTSIICQVLLTIKPTITIRHINGPRGAGRAGQGVLAVRCGFIRR